MKNERLISFFLRLGLAIVFLYAAIASFLDPLAWIGFFPAWMRDIFDAKMLLSVFSVYEIGLALWLLSGKRTFYAAMFAAATMAGIILTNLAILDIVFRDIAIFFSACALVALSARHS